MREASLWSRVLVASACAAVSALACDSVLDIEAPKRRAEPSGAGGEAAPGGSSSSGRNPNGAAGEGGTRNEAGSVAAPNGGAGTGSIEVIGGAAGAAGAANAPECEPDQPRCGGELGKSPQVCDNGHWVASSEEPSECPALCSDGKCQECEDGAKRCAVCQEGDPDCSTNQPQECTQGAWVDKDTRCANYCDAGACVTPTSCISAGSFADCPGGDSCCTSLLVPGGTFKRDYDGGKDYHDDGYPAEIGPFFLDKFEVTVGRMKMFLAAYGNLELKDGAGKSAKLSGDTGWSVQPALPSATELTTQMTACPMHTWAENNDAVTLPINCVPHKVAYAFCIWDGGRLPSDAEWDFAAAGGDQQRAYPWKPPASGPPYNPTLAFYGQVDGLPKPVGSYPKGDGRWGHADLGSNISEWTLDFYHEYSTDDCYDCVNLTAAGYRAARGGSYLVVGEAMSVSNRNYGVPSEYSTELGFRCARDLSPPMEN